jgi:hypothetical protein
MGYLVALDPQLGITASEFVTAWNASEHAEDAPASVGEAPQESFMAPEATVALIAAVASIPATVIANFVSEYLKHKFIEEDDPNITVTTISAPDGQPVLIVKQVEI